MINFSYEQGFHDGMLSIPPAHNSWDSQEYCEGYLEGEDQVKQSPLYALLAYRASQTEVPLEAYPFLDAENEVIRKTISQQNAKLRARKILEEKGLPIPPDLLAETTP